MKFLILTICCYTLWLNLQSQEVTKTFSRYGVFVDNDFFLEWMGLKKQDDDRNYTMGLGFYFANNKMGKGIFFKPLHLINRLFNHHDINDTSNMHFLLLGNGSFTPDNLQIPLPIKNDRPYGSVTTIQTGVSGFKLKRNTIDLRHVKSASFGIGILGSRLAENLQTFIHKKMNDNNRKPPYNPEGWPNQISDPWEPTFLYSVQHDFLLNKFLIHQKKQPVFQAKYGYRYSLGYNVGINGLFQFRTGLLNKLAWFNDVNNLQAYNKITFQNEISKKSFNKDLSLEFDNQDQLESKFTPELFFFGSARPVFILYNALLNGQFRRSVHTISFQDMKHLLFEFDGGIGFTFPFCKQKTALEGKIRVSGRSPEFELPGRKMRWHYWGGIELVYNVIN